MKAHTEKIPHKISDYIKEHFREDFLFEVKEVQQLGKHLNYIVEVSKDDFIHLLRFNENGDLVKEEAEQAFPPDTHEGPTFEDIPE